MTKVLIASEGCSIAAARIGSANGFLELSPCQVDFPIRSSVKDDRNHSTRKVFDHFSAMEVACK